MYVPTYAPSPCTQRMRARHEVRRGRSGRATHATRHLLLNLNQRRARQAVKRTRNKKKAGKE